MFLTALLLCLLPWAFAQAAYDPDDNSRPNNITGLYYRIYGKTGSYYNGSITFRLDLQDRNLQDDDSDEYSGTVCHSFIDKSISFTYTAMAAITKNSPDYQTTNPVEIDLYAVDEAFNLTWPSAMRNYSEYQTFELDSANSAIQNVWDFSLQNSTSSGFKVTGQLSKEGVQSQDLKLNLTHACGDESGASTRDEDEYLFDGGLVTPNWNDFAWESWADSVPWPSLDAEFDNNKASIDIGGLFSLHTANTAIVGRITIAFQGNLDELRSDELLTGGDRPEWNATLGFYGEGLDDNVGLRAFILNGWLILGSALLAIGLGFW